MLTSGASPSSAVESMQGLASPRLAHPGSPLSPGGPSGYPEEERGGGPYGGGGGRGSGGYGGPPLAEGPPLPDRPPFKAYLGNIPYDLDEEVVAHFFRGLDVSVRGRAGLGWAGPVASVTRETAGVLGCRASSPRAALQFHLYHL